MYVPVIWKFHVYLEVKSYEKTRILYLHNESKLNQIVCSDILPRYFF